jgi:cAMP-dependent protein kinase regulator
VIRRLDESSRAALIDSFDRIVAAAGTTLIDQGKPSPALYVIVAGGAEVIRTDDAGETLRLANLGPAEVFGEMSLVLERPASATVRTTHDSALLRLPRDRFLPVTGKHPGLMDELRRLTAAREEDTQSLLGRPSETVDDITLV